MHASNFAVTDDSATANHLTCATEHADVRRNFQLPLHAPLTSDTHRRHSDEMKHAKPRLFNTMAAHIAAINSIFIQGGERRFEKDTGNDLTASLNARPCLAFW
jgi:hypothetical protein